MTSATEAGEAGVLPPCRAHGGTLQLELFAGEPHAVFQNTSSPATLRAHETIEAFIARV